MQILYVAISIAIIIPIIIILVLCFVSKRREKFQEKRSRENHYRRLNEIGKYGPVKTGAYNDNPPSYMDARYFQNIPSSVHTMGYMDGIQSRQSNAKHQSTMIAGQHY